VQETTFLNADLDIRAKQGLKELVEAFGSSVIILNDETEGAVSLELESQSQYVDEAILNFYEIIHALPLEIRKIWDQCEVRSINIGIQAGSTPTSKEFRLSHSAISLLSSINAEVVITVYVFSK